MSITSGYTKYKRYQKLSDGTYQLVSQWTSSNTVHFDDGATAEAKIATMQTAIDGVNTKVNNLSELSAKQVEVLNERMNTFTALEDGSTTGDAELIDARIDKDGNIHENVGEHIRNITSQLSGEIEVLNQGGLNLKEDFIGEQVNEWLDEHPEATTTVQDGIITESKIHDDFLLYIKKDYITLEMFGGIANDESFDNHDAFLSALDYANKHSVSIYLGSGIYYFATPIVYTERLSQVTILGNGMHITNGTRLSYSGDGWFITLGICNQCEFGKFNIHTTSGANGLCLSNNFFFSRLHDISFSDCYNSLLIDSYAYAFLDRIKCTSSLDEVGVGIEFGGGSLTTEYIWIRSAIIQNAHHKGTGILYKGGIHTFIYDSDIVLCEYGIIVRPTKPTRPCEIKTTDLARNKYGLTLDSSSNYISNLNIKDVIINISEDADVDNYALYVTGTNYAVTSSAINIMVVLLGSVNPDNSIVVDDNKLTNSTLSVDSTYNLNMSFQGGTTPFTIEPTTLLKLHRFYRIYNSTATTGAFLLSTNSPFRNIPLIMANSAKGNINNVSVSNTFHGELKVDLTFNTAVNDIIEIFVCNGYSSQVKLDNI